MASPLQGAPSLLGLRIFKLTVPEGRGAGESLAQFPIGPGDQVLAERGYSTALVIHHGVSSDAQVLVCVNIGRCRFRPPAARRSTCWRRSPRPSVPASYSRGGRGDAGTLVCDQEDTKGDQDRPRQIAHGVDAQRQAGASANPGVCELRDRVHHVAGSDLHGPGGFLSGIVPGDKVERVFKRFNSLVQLGHLPTYDTESDKAWLWASCWWKS